MQEISRMQINRKIEYVVVKVNLVVLFENCSVL